MGCAASSTSTPPPPALEDAYKPESEAATKETVYNDCDVVAQCATFDAYVRDNNLVAVAMLRHWVSFTHKIKLRFNNDASSTHISPEEKTPIDMQPIVEIPDEEKIRTSVARSVGEAFLGYAMVMMRSRRWEGELHMEMSSPTEENHQQPPRCCFVRIYGFVSCSGEAGGEEAGTDVCVATYDVKFTFAAK